MILALAGNPNCGKTTLFNALTGANARTGNFPGVTVTRSEGVCRARPEITLVDLPGVYALRPYSDEERVTRSYLLSGAADAVISIADATCPARSLYLTLQLLELGMPVVLALNVMDALRAGGWSFASHSYTHNSGAYGFWGTGCIPDKIYYDINKWVDRVSPWIGETNLFLAPFGYRATGDALQHVLDAGFNIYCTVDDHVVNELYDDYALQSRIEIGGYSMTYYRDILNELFFDVDSVLDPDRPPVVYDE